MGCTLAELFGFGEEFKNLNSMDKNPIEKVAILEGLDENDKKCIYSIIDGLAAKQKLKKILVNALNEIE